MGSIQSKTRKVLKFCRGTAWSWRGKGVRCPFEDPIGNIIRIFNAVITEFRVHWLMNGVSYRIIVNEVGKYPLHL